MNTLVERLRDFRTLSSDWKIMRDTCEEAAKYIETLSKKNLGVEVPICKKDLKFEKR